MCPIIQDQHFWDAKLCKQCCKFSVTTAVVVEFNGATLIYSEWAIITGKNQYDGQVQWCNSASCQR